ncbi:MAG: hypothetical protein WCC68_06345 [Methanoregula sp.]
MPNASTLFDAGSLFLGTFWGNFLVNTLISLLIAIIGGLVAILFTIKYTTNQQRAIQINENLHRCLFEIIRNKNERLSENAIKEQLNHITNIVERKRVVGDLSEWPAFAKEECEFSQSNYYQYLLVDNIRYFKNFLQDSSEYPKKSGRISAVNRLFVLFEGFNRGLQDFERQLLNDVNALIQQGFPEKIKYDTLVRGNNNAVLEYYHNAMIEINHQYQLLDPENPADIEVHVTFFNQELH